MSRIIAVFLVIIIHLLWASNLIAQEVNIPTDTTQLMSVETKDGNVYVGYFRGIENGRMIVETTRLGRISLLKEDVKSIRPVTSAQMVNGQIWFENPHYTRYFFNTNGYGLRKGEGYYQNTWIFYNEVNYGFTDNLSVGVGVLPLFLFGGAPTPVWITPKVSIPIIKDKVNVGAGGLFVFVLGEEDVEPFGIAYGQMTLGSRDRNFNIGVGYGYAGGEWAAAPAISIGGMYRTGERFALVTENYFFDAGDTNILLLSGGGRVLLRRLAIDVGLVVPTATDAGLIAIPWLGLAVPFGK
jgi:hypothetical protein